MKLVFRIVFFLFIFILVGCKKDKKDSIPPVISATSPSNGQSYHMFDTITVSANVSDNIRLASINVVLTDGNHTPVQGVVSISITSVDMVFSIRYVLSEFRLQTGSYLMQITADDGYNSISSFQQIYIVESPTMWLGYCVNTKLNPQNIVGYDSTKTQNLTIPITSTYNGMKYGGYNQQLYINGSGSQPFMAYDMKNNIPAYYETATTNQLNYTCLATDGYKPYVGFKNGDIYSYTNTGIPSTSYRYAGAYPSYPYYFTTTSTNNVAVYKSTTLNNDAFVNFSAFGAAYNSVILFGNTPVKNVIAVFEKSVDSLYVFGNDSANKGVIDIYQFSTNRFSAAPIRLSDKITSAVKINNQYVVYSTTTAIYGCGNFSTPTSLQPTAAQKLIYQSKLNTLMAANGTIINAYTVGTNSLSAIPKMTLTLSDSVTDFEVITNK